jgi:hypothetical protein
MAALIRKLVRSAPRALIGFFIILVGVLSSVASDAGYLILIPLAATAFLALGRHPLAGLAAAYAGVSAIFAVNVLITPIDSMLTEITNEAISLTDAEPIDVTANFYFSIASSILLAIVAVFVTQRIVEPRLGAYDPAMGDPEFVRSGTTDGASTGTNDPVHDLPPGETVHDQAAEDAAEARGLRFAFFALLGMLAFILAITLPSGAPLRDPATGDIIGNTPFMASLIFLITLIFLACGIAYGLGCQDHHIERRRDRRRHVDVRRPRRARLHAADDRPVHRLLQLHEHAPGRGGRARRCARIGRVRRVAALARDDRRDHLLEHHHPRRRARSGRSSPRSSSRSSYGWGLHPRRCWRPTGSATRRRTWSPR